MSGYPHSLSTGNLPSTSTGPPMPQDAATNPPQIQHVRSMSDANFPMNPSNNPAVMANPNLTSQMQKMIEQQQRGRPPHPNMGQNLVANMMNNVGPSTGLPNRLNPGTGMGQPPQQPDQHQQSTKGKMVWRGALHWSGTGPMGEKKEMQVLVGAVQTNATPRSVSIPSLAELQFIFYDSHAETWPSDMSLAPIPAAPEAEFTQWMQRHFSQLVLVMFITPPGNTPTGRGNEANLASLMTLLIEKKLVSAPPHILRLS